MLRTTMYGKQHKILGGIQMTAKEYKDLSVKEFTKAAEIYESDNVGVSRLHCVARKIR